MEPVAIVGLSLGFPQEATSSETFWELLMKKKNTVTEFPKDRLNVDAVYHPDRNRRGQIPVRSGHFMRENIAAFDASFFSISPRDAATMDPQQRKLLEHTYRALENAGLPIESVAGSKTSVYVGCFTNDWQQISFKDSEQCGTTTALGSQPTLNANRISWFFNFTGNSANIDTACSSSLVALDFGCKDLFSGDTHMSIVAGCNLIFSPDNMHSLTNLNMLSPDGQCYSFDGRGNGYGRGEGFGVLVLKRLSDALRNHDTIRAIIRNTGCNQDGYTSSITEPNMDAQEALIRDTYSTANLSMQPTRYFEAHGTGTPVGDPIESAALGAAFRKTRTSQDPLWIGAVKSNIGHLEGCSGIASLIKTIFVLEKAVIPPNTNFKQINPKIDTEFLRIKFPLAPLPWPSKGLRRASVNSFGNSGTNAHVVLDDAFHYLQEHCLEGYHISVQDPPARIFPESVELRPAHIDFVSNPEGSDNQASLPKILVFSTHDETGIERLVTEYVSHFAKLAIAPDRFRAYLNNLVYTLDCRRTSLTWRSFAVVESLQDLQNLDKIIYPAQKSVSEPTLGFIFTGQGAQWAGMGCELTVYPAFEKSLQDAEHYFLELGSKWRLRDEMFKEAKDSSINRPKFSQPVCTAIQIALVDLLCSFGIRPTAVAGHSSGEIAAAYSLGAISAKAALKIAYCRGVAAAGLAENQDRQGAMMSVGLSESHIKPYIHEVEAQFGHPGLTVACINSYKNVTVSGEKAQVNALKSILDASNVFTRLLLVDVAYHSPHMQHVANDYRAMIQDIERGSGNPKSNTMISSVTGARITAEELCSPEYWVSNMVSPVRFSEALGHLFSRSAQRIRKKIDLSHRTHLHINMLLEIGPHSALQGPVRDTLSRLPSSIKIEYASLLLRESSAIKSTLIAVGRIKTLGYPLDLRKVDHQDFKERDTHMTLPSLPEYQFDHSKSYWYESRLSKRFRTHHQGKLDLLGKPVPDWNPLEARWRNNLRLSEMPWLEDHVVNGSLVYPGAGMLVVVIEAVNQMADATQSISGFQLKDIQFPRSINIPQDSNGVETQLFIHLSQDTSKSVRMWSEFRLCAYEDDQWHECCRGLVRVEYQSSINDVDGGKEESEELNTYRGVEIRMTESCKEAFDPSTLYKNLGKSGLKYGPSFQRITNGAFRYRDQSKGDIELFQWAPNDYPQSHIVHPATLDAIFHLSLSGYAKGGQRTIPTMVPTSLRSFSISKSGLSYPENTRVKTCTWMTAEDNRGAEFDLSVLNAGQSAILAQVQGLRLTTIAESAANDPEELNREPQNCYYIEYEPDPELLRADDIFPYRCNQGKEALAPADHYLHILARKNSALKIIEINGCAASSARTLDVLSTACDGFERSEKRYSSYHFTSDSQSVIDHAREQLQKYPQITFDLLDIEGDPLDQGFKAGTYDVLVARGCQEARLSLSRMRKLLRPNGKLVFCMSIQSEDQGKELPSIRNSWRESLFQSGFSSPRLETSEPTGEDSQGLITLISGAISEGMQTPIDKSITLVTEPSSGLQAQLSETLMTFLLSRHFVDVRVVDLHEASIVPNKDKTIFIVLHEVDQPFLYSLSSTETYSVLRQFLISSPDILWINTGGGSSPGKPEYALINGLARVLRNEYEYNRLTTIALDFQDKLTEEQLQNIVKVLEKNHVNPGPETNEPEYIEMNSELNIPRIVLSNSLSQEVYRRTVPQQTGLNSIAESPPLSLTIGSPGLLDTLHFVEDEIFAQPVADNEIEIQTQAVGLNFKDCLTALGQISGSNFGLECAGTVTRVGRQDGIRPGDRVLMASAGCFKTFSRGSITATCKIPEGISFIEAAAIPAQFGTAWVVIHDRARIQKGESILIHAAAGGTGQAAIQIAQFLGATVFVTVGSRIKKQLLIDEYGIPETHIFYSRDTSFAKGINRVTKGRGVDVVINSLMGEGLTASWECIASYGRFIEIGKRDIASNSNLPMFSFRKNTSFIGFDASTWLEERPMEVRRTLDTLIDLFAQKTFHTPRPLQVHSITDVSDVFRLLSGGNNSGKFVIEIQQKAQIPTTLNTKPGFYFDPNATYVIAGGLGGLGRSAARWMIGRNAKNLILLSRSGAGSTFNHAFLEELKGYGVRVEAPACDITNSRVMQDVLGGLVQGMPIVKGCVQGSMVARDELFENMSFENWRDAVNCKTVGSWNLHTILPKGMDFFILLSSASGLAGIRGQGNYDAGNTYEDALARYRVARGERAVSLDLGAMIDDGILSENQTLLSRVLAYGVLEPVNRERFFGILDYYCNPANPVLTPRESQAVIGIGRSRGSGVEGVDLSRQPMLRELFQNRSGEAAYASSGNGEIKFRELFSKAASLVDASNIVIQALVKKLSSSLLTLQSDDADIYKPIQSYGVDSLLAIELRNWIAKEFRANVAVFETQGGSTFSTLGMLVAGRSELKNSTWTS